MHTCKRKTFSAMDRALRLYTLLPYFVFAVTWFDGAKCKCQTFHIQTFIFTRLSRFFSFKAFTLHATHSPLLNTSQTNFKQGSPVISGVSRGVLWVLQHPPCATASTYKLGIVCYIRNTNQRLLRAVTVRESVHFIISQRSAPA